MAASSGARGDIRDPKTRVAISQMDKLELEDRHYRLMEENLALKKYSRSQEEKMKKMATKLLRLSSDEKREAKREGLLHNSVHHHGDLEGELDDALSKNRDLDKQNTALKSKLLVLKQQLESHGKRHTPYDRVQSRVSTGIRRRSQRSVSTEGTPDKKPTARDASTQMSSVPCHNLLEEVRKDNQELEDQLFQSRQELSALKAERERSREQQRLRSAQLEEEKLKLQDELETQITVLQQANTEGEMALLKVKRELRDKNARLDVLNAQYVTLERNNDLLKTSQSRVIQEMEALNKQLKEEHCRNSELQSQLVDSRLSQRTISELTEMVEDLRGERDRLREANDRISRRHGEVLGGREQQLKSQLKIAEQKLKELEAEARREQREKIKIIDELTVERKLNENLDEEMKEMRATYLQLKEDYHQIKDKLSFFNKESSIDWSEVEEALVMVQQNKTRGEGALSFLTQPEVKGQDDVQELRVNLADTINELEKTRQLLKMQHTINKEYKNEVESVTSRMAEKDHEHSSQLQEYAQLLDIKAARIKKLEGQLRDIAYGTRQVKVDTRRFEYLEEPEENVQLERGQNLLQFHVGRVTLSSEATSKLHTTTPALFVGLNFSNYESQISPVKLGCRPQFDYTTNYVVTVDDAFLQQLHKGSVSIEVNQGLGFKYQTLAVATVKCTELTASSGGKVHGKVSLTGVNRLQECVCVGSLEYWMRLKLPITQALRLYQERSKAISAIDGHLHTVTPHTPSHTPSDALDYNELVVTVYKCHSLSHYQSGRSPNCYVMYKFYTFPDHDTQIITRSAKPVFNDTHSYPLSMDQRLHEYLSMESLEVYLFDDLSTEEDYVGVAHVPLLKLSEGQPITGTFQLLDMSEELCGYLDLSVRWKHPYHTPTPPTPPLTVIQSQTLPPTPVEVVQPPITETKEPAHSKTTEKHSVIPKEDTDIEGVISKPAVESSAMGHTDQMVIDKKSKPDEKPLVLQETGNILLEGGKDDSGAKMTGSKKTTKVVRHKTKSKPHGTKQSKQPVALRRNTEPLPELKNSLPPLRQEPQALKPETQPQTTTKRSTTDSPVHRPEETQATAAQTMKEEKSSPMKTASPSLSMLKADSKTDQLQATNVPDPNSSLANEPDSNDDFSVTDTESMMSSLTELERAQPEPPTVTTNPSTVANRPPTESTPVISAASSQVSLTPSDKTPTGDATAKAGGTREDGEVAVDEIEEVLSDESDTMFEDPLHQTGTDDVFSGLSEHSSDEISAPVHPPQNTQAPHFTPSQDPPSDDDWSQITPSGIDKPDRDPITSNNAQTLNSSQTNTVSVTVESFTMETDSPLYEDSRVSNLFVEYQFLDFDYEELETPTSLPKPAPGETIVFDFKKVFELDSDQLKLLADMLRPGDPSGGRLVFTVVADPEDQEADCEEVGTAELDLNKIVQSGEDLHSESIDVVSCEDADTVGFLTVSVQAVDTLLKIVL